MPSELAWRSTPGNGHPRKPSAAASTMSSASIIAPSEAPEVPTRIAGLRAGERSAGLTFCPKSSMLGKATSKVPAEVR